MGGHLAAEFGGCVAPGFSPAQQPYTGDSARYRIDEAHLFIEAAHSWYQRISTPEQPVATQSKGTVA